MELIIVLIIILILFGGARLPRIGKGIGQAISNFKKAFSKSKEIDIKTKKKESKTEDKR